MIKKRQVHEYLCFFKNNVLLALSFFLLALSLFWMSFATGTVTFFLDTLKFTPAFFLFSLSFILFFCFLLRSNHRLVIYDSVLLKVMGLHILLTFFPAIFWSKGYDTTNLISLNLGYFALVFLILNLFRGYSKIFTLFFIVLIIVAVISVAGILEYFGIILWRMNTKGSGIASFFLYPTVYSGFLILLLPICFLSFFIFKNSYVKYLSIFISLIGFVNLILSQSRASIIAFFFSFVVFLFLYFKFIAVKKKYNQAIAIAVIVIVAVFVTLVIFNAPLGAKLRNMLVTKNPRWVIYGMAIRMWLKSPLSFLFGQSIGSFKYLSFTYKPPGYRALTSDRGWDAAHNEYLELLVDGGIFSLIAFFILCSYILLIAYRIIKNQEIGVSVRYAVLALSLSIISFLIDNLFSTNSRVSFNMYFFYIFVALVEVIAHLSGIRLFLKRNSKRTVNTKAIKITFLVPCIIILTLLNIGFWLRFASEWNLAQALKRSSDKKYEIITKLQKAQKIDPRSIYPWYFLAENYLFDGKYSDFKAAAEQVEDRIPNFKGITLMRAIAATAQKGFHPASQLFNQYLHLDRYDLTAETYLLFVYALLNDWDNVTKRFIRIVEDDFFLEKYGKVLLSFPIGIESVKLYEDHRGIHIEFGTLSMETIVKEVVKTTVPVLNGYFFRFHYVLGKVYHSFGLTELALKHFQAGSDNFLFTKKILSSSVETGSFDTVLLEYSDQDKYNDMGGLLQSLLGEMIQKHHQSGNQEKEKGYLKLYLRFFSDPAIKARLVSIYQNQRQFKAIKQLKLKQALPARE